MKIEQLAHTIDSVRQEAHVPQRRHDEAKKALTVLLQTCAEMAEEAEELKKLKEEFEEFGGPQEALKELKQRKDEETPEED